MKKGQSWSIDIILAVIVFLSVFIFLFSFLLNDSSSSLGTAREESIQVLEQVAEQDSSLSFIEKDQLNDTQALELAEQDYESVKQSLGLLNDFCIYFEDEFGNLITLNDSVYGIGSSEINVSGVPCSSS